MDETLAGMVQDIQDEETSQGLGHTETSEEDGELAAEEPGEEPTEEPGEEILVGDTTTP
jgi:hypothetical protein